jgi:hypothetical protein
MVDPKKRDRAAAPQRLRMAAIGMEAECALLLDGQPTRPETLFGSPRDFIRGELMHRQGTSYHLPTGGAVYFDTGVIEVATPVIEIERGCAARAGRSLWEALQFIRGELDAWDARKGRETRLVGFSAHYNVSFELPPGQPANGRTIEQLAELLTYILPAPVMLLATNRRSTGVGVRPREDRIEITSDFTPSAALMIATATLIVGIVREVMTWPSYGLDELARRGIPVISGFQPMPHTSRKGWLARFDCYPKNPFACDIDSEPWNTERHGQRSLRAIAALDRPHGGSVHLPLDRLRRARWQPVAARPGRSPPGIRARRPALRLGRPVSARAARSLALRARGDPRGLRPAAAHGWPHAAPGRHERLVGHRVPARRRQPRGDRDR